MHLFIKTGWKQLVLQVLNRCRMYLLFLLSDIMTGAGTTITMQFWDQPHLATSPFDWPRTTAPSQKSWITWCKVLTSVLHHGRNQWLTVPLGKCFVQSHPTGWYYHQHTNSIWEVHNTQWLQHGGIPQHMCQLSFHSHSKVTWPPPLIELECATMVCCGQKITLTRCSPCEQGPQGIDPCHQLRETLISRQWNLAIDLIGAQQEMQVAFSQGIGYMVSDGSFKDTAGVASWIIKGPTLDLWLIGQWHTPGPPKAHSTFRSKLAGIVGILYMLTFWPPMMVKPHFRIACDGLSVITRLCTPQLIEPMGPHFDLLMVAQILLTPSNILLTLFLFTDTKTMVVPQPLPEMHGWISKSIC